MNAAPSHKGLSPRSMSTYAGLCLVHAALGLEPARIEVWIKRLSSPLQLTSDIAIALCEHRNTRENLHRMVGC